MAALAAATCPLKPSTSPVPLHKPSSAPPPFSVSFRSPDRRGRLTALVTTRFALRRRLRPEDGEAPKEEALDLSRIITSTSVRLIDEEHNMVGIVPKVEAMQMAEEAKLDLVILSTDSDPPVLKIMDYHKHKYEKQRNKRTQQKKSTGNSSGFKELKMGQKIDIHDYSVRLKAALKFLKEGSKIKILIRLKGRDKKNFKSEAIMLMKRFQNDVAEIATLENKDIKEKNIFFVLTPNKAAIERLRKMEENRKRNVEKENVDEENEEKQSDDDNEEEEEEEEEWEEDAEEESVAPSITESISLAREESAEDASVGYSMTENLSRASDGGVEGDIRHSMAESLSQTREESAEEERLRLAMTGSISQVRSESTEEESADYSMTESLSSHI